ncbi:two-component regulator propeller domain-containing protein [Lacinutrix iliipiscaria]|uniref:histidine kinase n=1 Tax=Lacinutrix iliipiscaria TaxID=1230532 RepID=A0ABW5WQT9_9FLAO
MNHIKFFFFCFIPIISFSQSNNQIAFRELTVEHGLSQNSVVSIAQDSTGFMWFATQDGLNKYDGRKFKHYDIQFEDVTRSTYSKLGKTYVDKKGRLWVVSNSGKLEYYLQETDRFQAVSNMKHVSTLIQDTNQDYYIGTYNHGLYKIKPQTQDTLQFLKPNHAALTIYDFLETNNQTILAATNNGIIEIKDSHYEMINIAPQTNFSALATSKTGVLYLGSYGKGLFVKSQSDHNFKSFKGFSSQQLPNNLIIQDLLVDSQNRLWIATYGQGLFVVDFNLETIQNFTENKNNPYALHYNDVLSLYQDYTGTIWLGTDGTGLSYYDAYLVKFNILTNDQVPQNVNVDVIRAITIDKNGAIWVGTSGKGLTRIHTKNQEFFTYTSENSNLLGDRIMSLLYDDDVLWIGHQSHGLQMMDAKGKMTTFNETADFTIWKIFKDALGNMWLCTRDHGLIKFDESTGVIKEFSLENSSLTSNNIRTIEQGEANILWVGSESDGLYQLNIKNNSLIKVEGISDKIKSLYYHDDILWIGTNGNGLKSYHTKNKTIFNYTKKEGLPNDVIYSILSDENKNLWLSSNKGITKLSIVNDLISDIENYGNYDGLQAFEFNTGAYFKDSKGMLYFGGLEGLNWFNPNDLEFNPIQPKTIISGFEVFNKERELIENQNLKADENTVTFTFSSLHFSQPERNQYKYRLINNDDDWIVSGNNNVAHYTNLPPNDYEFQVISSNYDGVWNHSPATYSFTILKPWYATNYAKTLYVLLGLFFAFGLYKYLKWRWQMKMQLQFEHKETERLKKLDEFKTKLYTNISHEFRTPLTLISGPIDHQLAKPELSKKDKRELTLVKQNADRLLKLVEQMLNLSMIDSGQIKLKVSEGNLSVLLKQIASAFQYKANQRNINIKSNIQDLKQVWFDKDIIEKVTSNLLSNAVKYAPQHSVVIFEAKQQDEMLVLSVINTSDSVGKNDLSKLFQRFYQDNELSEGVGVGLALVRDLVTLAKGTIIANNIDDNKIQFTVSLPIQKTAFSHSEIFQNNTIENQEELMPEATNNTNPNKPTLLIVEDDSEIREFIQSTFKSNYTIIEAINGKIGIEKANKNLPDLIISDIMMPVQSGIELCHAIKTNELTSHIPVILLTAKVGEVNEIEGIKTGADAYVTKPFNIEKLKIRVEKLIESRQKIKKHFSQTFQINPDLAITSTESDFLKKLQAVLNQHITNSEFNSDAFAKHMHISRAQLHRKLKAITEMSTSEFIRSQRLKSAIKLLQNSDATVAEIAYQVGFNSPSYFSKCFKEVYGCTPNEYTTSA